MKKIALLAVLLSTAAYAQTDAPSSTPEPKPQERKDIAGPPTPVPTGEVKTVPAPPPSVWMIQDLDSNDLNTINSCVLELPKKVADQFIQRLSAKIKVVK